MFRHLSRKLISGAAAISMFSLSSSTTLCESCKEALERIRKDEKEMRLRWIRDEDGWRKLPSRAWPEVQPPASEIDGLDNAFTKCNASETISQGCDRTKFHLATALLFNNVDAKRGRQYYLELAEKGSTDGMVATAVCLLEGFGGDYNEAEGTKWLKKAVELGSVQGMYELGVLHYTGAIACVEEDEAKAKMFFEQTAAQNHTSGQFMVADMLMEQDKVQDEEIGRAISLLYLAADKGHRFARQTLLSILDEGHPVLAKLRE